MGVVLTIIVRAIMYGVILVVFLSPVPAWLMMLGGANRMIKKTEGSLKGKDIRNIGRVNLSKVKNYFKNGGGQGQFDLPDEGSFYSDEEEINSMDDFRYNPVETNDEYAYNPISKTTSMEEGIFEGVERVDVQEVEGTPIKVTQEKSHEKVKEEFFSDTFWDTEIK